MVVLKALLTLVSVDDAVERLASALARFINLDVETINTINATGRILAEDIYATIDRPEEDISAVDGYAVRSIDTVSASHYNPVELVVKGTFRPDKRPTTLCVEPGTAIRVYTGTPVPCNADAIIMSEDVRLEEDRILIYKPVAQGSNVIFRGEDFKRGDLLATKGTVVKPALITALVASGISKVKTYRKINVSVIAVGDELVEPGEEKLQGEVYNSSAYVVYSMLNRDFIFDARYAGIVPDSVSEVEDAILKEFERGADVVITTGSTGIGEFDIVADLIEKRGTFIFRGVRMRPGRPTSSSIIDKKPLLHLSGFPVAAWTGYEVLFRAAITKWLSIRGFERRAVYALLTRRLPNVVGYKSIVRVNVFEQSGELYAEPYMLRGSGVISSLLKTNGYVILPENVEGFEKNTKVQVYMYD